MSTVATLNWKEQCKNLLDILNQSKDSVPFRAPVNIERLPHYLLIIDYPMDLQTVGKKLQDGNYATPSEFAKDVRLIFENSKKFKPNTKSMMYEMTDRLSLLFEDHIRNFIDSYGDRKAAAQGKKNGRMGCYSVEKNFVGFIGKSKISIEAKSGKGKSLAPTNFQKDIQIANGVKSSQEQIVPSQKVKEEKVAN